MLTCTFAGHRQIFASGIPQKLDEAIEGLLAAGGDYRFLTGGMGEFDLLCAAAVRRAKRRHPGLAVELLLVLPYMKQDINANKAAYEDGYDDILVPTELLGAYPKQAIGRRNRWMIDRSDALLAYVCRAFGGAYETLRYAQKRPGLSILNLAERQTGRDDSL